MEDSQALPQSVVVLEYTIRAALEGYGKNEVEYRQILALQNLFFPKSKERHYLIEVHARAAALGKIEIESCGERLVIEGQKDIFKRLVGYFKFQDEYEMELLKNDFYTTLNKILSTRGRIF